MVSWLINACPVTLQLNAEKKALFFAPFFFTMSNIFFHFWKITPCLFFMCSFMSRGFYQRFFYIWSIFPKGAKKIRVLYGKVLTIMKALKKQCLVGPILTINTRLNQCFFTMNIAFFTLGFQAMSPHCFCKFSRSKKWQWWSVCFPI